MTVQSRSTLKSYFISGASPSESDFSDLIDSTLLVEDIVTSLDSTSTTDPLAASLGKSLNDSITLIDSRVETLENAENNFAENYYNKTEVDSLINGVDSVITSLPYGTQITDLQSQIDATNLLLSEKPDANHTHSISNIVSLQSELDAKASIEQLNSVRDSLIDSINAIDTSGGSVDLTSINNSISQLTTDIEALESSLNSQVSHDHNDDVYTKSQVDTLIAGINLESHEHVSADITDFNQQIETKTNLLVSDHASLINNPHSVTKEQVGLGNVENLTPSEIIDLAGGVSQLDIDTLTTTVDNHIALNNNPHGVTKSDIGLSLVPNLNPLSLLDDHLAQDNPHNIDLSYFDVYAKAEADARTVFHIDSVRYAFTPLQNDDSAGAIGDFGYDSENLYFKVGNTDWRKLPFNPVYIQREATQEDVDAGLADNVGDIISVNEVSVQDVTNISITETFNITNVDGDNVFEVTEGGISLTNTTIEGDTIVEGNTIINETISSSTENVTIQDNTTVEGSLNVTTNTTIEGDTVLKSDTSVEGPLTVTNNTFNVTDENGDDILEVTDTAVTINKNTSIGGDVSITGGISVTEDLSVAGDINISENLTAGATELSSLVVTGDSTFNSVTIDGGSFTNISSIETGDILSEVVNANLLKFWTLNKFQTTGGSSVPLASTLSVNFTSQRLTFTNHTTQVDELAFVSDLPDLSGYALKSELGTGGSTSSSGELLIEGNSSSGNGYTGDEDFYAIDYGGDGTFGTGDDIEEEYWSATSQTNVSAGIVIDYGNPSTNPYIKYNINSSEWQRFNGTEIYDLTQAQELLIHNSSGSDPYIRYDAASGEWTAFNGSQLVNIGQTTTNTTINETTVLQQTIIQEGLTIDAQSGGEENGYAYTEGAGKYSIDYGADNTFGTADDDDSEDYFEIDAEGYQSAGLTVNVGLNPNPSIIYDVAVNKWLLDEGGSNGQFHIGDVTQSYTKTESDARYKPISSTPQELFLDLSGTSSDPYIRYDTASGEWTAFNGTTLETIGASTTIINEGDNVTNTTILEQTIIQESLTVDGTTGGAENGYSYAEYDDGTGTFVAVKYSIDYGADNTFGTADDDDSEDYFEVVQGSYNNAGLTVNAGLDANPFIKYDGAQNKWLVDNGEQGATDYGSFFLKDVDAAVADLVDSAPSTLDTLNELAAALGDDPNFATTTSTALGDRYTKTSSDNLLTILRSQSYAWDDSPTHKTTVDWASGAVVKSGANYYKALQTAPTGTALSNTAFWSPLPV